MPKVHFKITGKDGRKKTVHELLIVEAGWQVQWGFVCVRVRVCTCACVFKLFILENTNHPSSKLLMAQGLLKYHLFRREK